MTENINILNRTIDHNVMVRGFETMVQHDASQIVRKHRTKLGEKLRVDRHPDILMRTQVMPEIKRFKKELMGSLKTHSTDLARVEVDFNVNNLDKSVNGFANVKRPNQGRLLDEAVNKNFQGNKSLDGHIGTITKAEMKRITSSMHRDMARRVPRDKMISNVQKTTKLTGTQASSLVRTSITNVQSASQVGVLRQNEDLIKGYEFTAILDSKTSQVCAHHDDEIYDVDDKRYVPPLHWRCRSSLVPILKSRDEMMRIDSTQISKRALNAMDAATAARFTGVPAPKTSYNEWLKKQPRDVKLRHLGDETKVDMFDRGRLELNTFTTPEGKGRTLTSVRRLDNKATSTIPGFSNDSAINTVNRDSVSIPITKPSDVINNKDLQKQLTEFFTNESMSRNSVLVLTDYKGTTLRGKRGTRRRSENVFDERNNISDPLTGESRSTLVYSPDFNVLQERLDFLSASKILSTGEKDFIRDFVNNLDKRGVSINQQTAIVENLRINFERYNKKKVPWDNYVAVTRAELPHSVVNVSRVLDRRSRSKAQVFSAGDLNNPSVEILGVRTSFDDMAARTLKNQRFVRDWEEKTGQSLARRAYFNADTPLSAYLQQIPDSLPTPKKALKNIEKKIKAIPFGNRLLRSLQGKPNDTLLNDFLAKGSERKRKILDFEFLYIKNRKAIQSIRGASNTGTKNISKAMKTIATGYSTDYDSLAIQIGKDIYKRNKSAIQHFIPSSTLKNHHKIGSRLLNGLERQGKIRVGSRGVLRRGVIDLDSGRPAVGSFQNTLSREVTVVDSDMLALQRASQELVYSRRIGIVNDRDRLYAKVGETDYIDGRGAKTGISIITKKAGGNYDKNLVDRDFANMLNHTMRTSYMVDNDFSSFFEDLAYFRDPRGNLEKYDELNGFRKIILQRGEAGAGLIQTARWHRNNGKPFTNQVQIDGRGRVYTGGYLHPTGGELVRPFLNSARAKAMTPESVGELRIHIGSAIGDPKRVLTNKGRLEVFYENEKGIRELGELMLSKTQRQQRLREFMEHPLMVGVDPLDIPRLARLALEYTRVYNHTKGDFGSLRKVSSYKTQLMIENDASASGAQIIALSTRNKQLAVNSNVVATQRKQRLYDLVGEATISDPRFQKLGPAVQNISFKDLTLAAKEQNLVSFYGAGKTTQIAAIEGVLSKILGRQGLLAITNAELRSFKKSIDFRVKDAERLGAVATAERLKSLKREIVKVVEKEAPVGDKLRVIARDAHPDVEDFVNKITNNTAGLVGPNQFREISAIMSEKLSDIAPITEKFITFWKDLAPVYLRDSKSVDIPWVTFDNKLLYQRYRPKVQERIDFIDPVTKRRVQNVYEDTVTDGDLIGQSSLIDARGGLGVNGNHMNDAAIVRQYHLWAIRNNVETATVHDAFFTNISDAAASKDALRQIYGDAIDGETLRKTLDAMKRTGLSDKEYNNFIERARRDGLLDVDDPLTRQDILREVGPDESWYGMGP